MKRISAFFRALFVIFVLTGLLACAKDMRDVVGQNVNVSEANTPRLLPSEDREADAVAYASERATGTKHSLLQLLNLETREVVRTARKAVVALKRIKSNDLERVKSANAVSREISIGSGVLIDARGYIITNDHVIAGVAINNGKRESVVLITLPNGKIIEGVIIARNSAVDLALIKIADGMCNDFCENPISFGNSDAVYAGENVIVIGNPFNFEGTVTRGIVSFEKRDADKYGLDSPGNSFIQVDAPINFGNSGGVLINDRGEMVGVVRSTSVQHGLRLNIGFVIPSNDVRSFFVTAVDKTAAAFAGAVIGWIGMKSEQILYEEYQKINDPLVSLNGIVVRSVSKGGPAAKAGLQKDDIVISAEGKEFFGDEFEFYRYIRSRLSGSKITLRVFGAKSRLVHTVDIFVKEKPSDEDAWQNIDEAGVPSEADKKALITMFGVETVLLENYPDIITQYGVGFVFPHHLLIIDVLSKSIAERDGLRKGDIILGYDGRSLKDWAKNGFSGKAGFEEYLATKAGDMIYIAIFRKEKGRDIITLKLK